MILLVIDCNTFIDICIRILYNVKVILNGDLFFCQYPTDRSVLSLKYYYNQL